MPPLASALEAPHSSPHASPRCLIPHHFYGAGCQDVGERPLVAKGLAASVCDNAAQCCGVGGKAGSEPASHGKCERRHRFAASCSSRAGTTLLSGTRAPIAASGSSGCIASAGDSSLVFGTKG